MATCIVYVCLTVVIHEHLLAYSLSYVIILRLWRLGRLYHGLYLSYCIEQGYIHRGSDKTHGTVVFRY